MTWPTCLRLSALGLTLLACAAPAQAQESKLHAEFRREGERLKEHCDGVGVKALISCAMSVVTDHPVHLTLGSIAPGNGFSLGPAFVMRHNPNETWRLSWSADAVAAPGGAWRAGAYMKLVHVPDEPIGVVFGPVGAASASRPAVKTYPVLTLHGQTISLPEVSFFGLGQDSARDSRTTFGLRQTMVGASLIAPQTNLGIFSRLNLAVLGEVNGRVVRIRAGDSPDVPSIGDAFEDVDAPGLSTQPAFIQFGEGIGIAPDVPGGRLRLDYRVQFQQFIAVSDSRFSFRRWTLDLSHDVPLYREVSAPVTRSTNSPNDCALGPSSDTCPSVTRNRTGTAGIRIFASRSGVSGASAVPFYFQHTMGGSDINGVRQLAGYDDYRFRGPHLLLFQETLEHSLYGPVGLQLMAEQGRVARQDEGLRIRDLTRSVSVGLTIRAGGVPMIVISHGWSQNEGRHFAFTMNASLLGGSSRPSIH